MRLDDDAALVLFSGGQDSTTCLAWTLERFRTVETVGFAYGQRHSIELECRSNLSASLRTMWPEWGERLGVDHMLELPVLGAISDTALTRDSELRITEAGLPSTFVPGRNLIFLTLAGAVAYRRGIRNLVVGVCETDFSGYPDCRDDTVKAVQVAMNLGMETKFTIHTPLMWIDKASTWQMAGAIGGDPLVELIRTQTHSCYLGSREILHPWGYGCGHCFACELRAAGYARYCEVSAQAMRGAA